MVEIPLVGSRDEVAIIDDEDLDLIQGHKWRLHSTGRYAVWITRRSGVRTNVLMHRVILNAPHGLQVDHIDRDGLNNRRANLRLATRVLNNHNRAGYGRSPFKGVHLDPRKAKPWRATINNGGTCTHLGYFGSQEDAARAYDEAARERYGQDAVTNFGR